MRTQEAGSLSLPSWSFVAMDSISSSRWIDCWWLNVGPTPPSRNSTILRKTRSELRLNRDQGETPIGVVAISAFSRNAVGKHAVLLLRPLDLLIDSPARSGPSPFENLALDKFACEMRKPPLSVQARIAS
jgi:hypothetical protein